MIGTTYTGAAYTNIPATGGQVSYPSNETGTVTTTAGSSFTVSSKRVVIYAVVVRTYTASSSFTLETHAGTEVGSFTPTGPGTISFGPIGLELQAGWRITMGGTGSTLLVVWKNIL